MSSKMVRCDKCAFVDHIIVPANILGDGYCPVSGKTLVGLANNGQAIRQPRKCDNWKKKPLGRKAGLHSDGGPRKRVNGGRWEVAPWLPPAPALYALG